MEIKRSDEVCDKHCPRKFENLTNAEKCPFNLIEWSIETESDISKLNTQCSKMGAYLEEIIIKRIIDITKGAVKVLKETITQRKIPIVDTNWPNTKINQPGDVIYPHYPGVSIDQPVSPLPDMQIPHPGPWMTTTGTDTVQNASLFPNKE